jgi:hypothetical protein
VVYYNKAQVTIIVRIQQVISHAAITTKKKHTTFFSNHISATSNTRGS